MSDAVRFKRFETVLLGLGFEPRPNQSNYMLFVHPQGATLLFRRYDADEEVLPAHLVMASVTCDMNGILSSKRFDAVLDESNYCAKCGVTVGRAGRTNEELVALNRAGLFSVKIEAWDYNVDPPKPTSYCPKCWAARPKESP